MFLDISNEEYHKRPGVSASMLKSMARGWRTFEAEHIAKTAPRKESAAMALGTAVHTALLESERFDAGYVSCPVECSDRRTKVHKEWLLTVEGRDVISQDDMDVVQRIKSNVARDAYASQLLGIGGEVEKSYEWKELDLLCRARFDKKHGPFVIDIKTCQDAREDAFRKTIESYRYDLQAAHYLSGLESIGRGWGLRFVFIAVETLSPYRVRCHELSDDDMEKAFKDRSAILRAYKTRLESGDWSEDGEGRLTTLYLSKWFSQREVMV